MARCFGIFVFLLYFVGIEVHCRDFTASIIDSQFDCDIAAGGSIGPLDSCYIHSVGSQRADAVLCRNAGQCIITCSLQNGLYGANILAQNSLFLNITSNAHYCLSTSTVYAPNNGNATITIGANYENAYMMTVHDGANTDSISITCIGTEFRSSLECGSLIIHANHSQYVFLVAMSVML